MGLFDVIKSYVHRTQTRRASRKSPLDDFGGDNFLELPDFSELESAFVAHDFGGTSVEVMGRYMDIEDVLEGKLLDDIPADADRFVTQFYDANSAADYVGEAPAGILMVYAEYGEDDEFVFSVFRFDSGGEE